MEQKSAELEVEVVAQPCVGLFILAYRAVLNAGAAKRGWLPSLSDLELARFQVQGDTGAVTWLRAAPGVEANDGVIVVPAEEVEWVRRRVPSSDFFAAKWCGSAQQAAADPVILPGGTPSGSVTMTTANYDRLLTRVFVHQVVLPLVYGTVPSSPSQDSSRPVSLLRIHLEPPASHDLDNLRRPLVYQEQGGRMVVVGSESGLHCPGAECPRGETTARLGDSPCFVFPFGKGKRFANVLNNVDMVDFNVDMQKTRVSEPYGRECRRYTAFHPMKLHMVMQALMTAFQFGSGDRRSSKRAGSEGRSWPPRFTQLSSDKRAKAVFGPGAAALSVFAKAIRQHATSAGKWTQEAAEGTVSPSDDGLAAPPRSSRRRRKEKSVVVATRAPSPVDSQGSSATNHATPSNPTPPVGTTVPAIATRRVSPGPPPGLLLPATTGEAVPAAVGSAAAAEQPQPAAVSQGLYARIQLLQQQLQQQQAALAAASLSPYGLQQPAMLGLPFPATSTGIGGPSFAPTSTAMGLSAAPLASFQLAQALQRQQAQLNQGVSALALSGGGLPLGVSADHQGLSLQSQLQLQQGILLGQQAWRQQQQQSQALQLPPRLVGAKRRGSDRSDSVGSYA